jgi:biotin synthase-like enzyme
MSTVKNTKYYSKKVGELCEGCQRCVKGEKLVLFITGICPRACYFCPVSDDKINKDVIRANERIIKNEKDFKSIVAEAEICFIIATPSKDTHNNVKREGLLFSLLIATPSRHSIFSTYAYGFD